MRNLIRARKTPNTRDLWIGPLLDRSFRVSISLKGLHALLETICAIALLKIDPQTMNRFVLGRSASRTLRRSTRFRRHAPNPCVSVLCGQRKVLRLFVSSFARRRQTRARCSLAKKQTLGISLDDCHFSGVCLLSDLYVRSLPFRFDDSVDVIRCRRHFSYLARIRTAEVSASNRIAQDNAILEVAPVQESGGGAERECTAWLYRVQRRR